MSLKNDLPENLLDDEELHTGVFQRDRKDTMDSQVSSIDFSEDISDSEDTTEADEMPDMNFSPSSSFTSTNSFSSSSSISISSSSSYSNDPLITNLRRKARRHAKPNDDTSSDDDTDDDQEEPPAPVLQRSTTFERVLSDAIVHQSPIEELKVILAAGAKLIDPIATRPNPIQYTVWQRYPEATELLLEQGTEYFWLTYVYIARGIFIYNTL